MLVLTIKKATNDLKSHNKLHYPQTAMLLIGDQCQFYYHMKLHYSQTLADSTLTNGTFYYHMKLHYSQTALNAQQIQSEFYYHMKLHYSQTYVIFCIRSYGFTTIWNYTTLKLIPPFWNFCNRFTTIWNYTTLKLKTCL